jgi:mRNA-degrading endonuclease RelE of RelBE toxin-antitoxin system
VGSFQETGQIDIYDIKISSGAKRGLLSVPRNNRPIIFEAIDDLATNPRPANSKLLYKAENLRRLTVGDYRVIYGIEESLGKVTIELVRHRSIAYAALAALVISVRSRYSR